jgi:DNA-binding NtrC family response regulator
VEAPPLRERKEDVPLLARHFLKLFASEMGREAPELSPPVLELLSAYAFPGNVRELKNIIERELIESGSGPLEPHHLHFQTPGSPALIAGSTDPAGIPLNLRQAELWLIKKAIARTQGNISEAARLLGTNRTHVYRALAQEEE